MLPEILNWALIATLIACGLCLIGLIVPFRPFGSRRRAAWSLLAMAGALFATNISLAAVAPPASTASVATRAAPAGAAQPDPARAASTDAESQPDAPAADTASADAAVTPEPPPAPVPGVPWQQLLAAAGDAMRAAADRVADGASGLAASTGAMVETVRLTIETGDLPALPGLPVTEPVPGQRFPDAAFSWTGTTQPHRDQIVALVNRIAAQHAGCPDPDPLSVTRSSWGTADDPVFMVTCGTGRDAFRIRFRPRDAAAGRVFAAVPPLSPADAVAACAAAARARVAGSESLRFPEDPDMTFVDERTGRARVQATFTAGADSGRAYAIDCEFEGPDLIEATVVARAG